jgi:hypothetical protein
MSLVQDQPLDARQALGSNEQRLDGADLNSRFGAQWFSGHDTRHRLATESSG